MTPRRRVAALATICLVVAGCTAGDPSDDPAAAGQPAPRVVQPGAPGEESRELSTQEITALEDLEVAHTDADVGFVHGMIAHHVQALRMTRLVDARTRSEDIPLLAERMDLSQQDELELMQRWLEDRDEPVPSLLAGHDGHDEDADIDGELMPGMLSEAELAELEAADGATFDRRFLEGMITHHLGALAMVEDFQADEDASQDPGLTAFANHVYGDQEIEIHRMRSMLEELDADR